MDAGKTLDLLKVAYNYEEKGKKVLLMTSSFDDRYGVGRIQSRVGIGKDAIAVDPDTSILSYVEPDLACVLIDEANLLTAKQVMDLTAIVDDYGIPVICYGLRVDYRGLPFEGSTALMALADSVEEIKTICHCGRKATMNTLVRNGQVVRSGPQVVIENDQLKKDNTLYVSLCRKHWKSGEWKPEKLSQTEQKPTA